MGGLSGATRALVSALLLSLLLAGCATPPQVVDLRRTAVDLPPQAAVAQVPFFPQEDYYCGPASLAMVLAWSGLKVSQDDIAPEVYTPGRVGTLQPDILTAARRHGRLAVQVNTLHDMLKELAAGNPVLVFQNLGLSWVPQWHYAVATGYDLTPGDLVLHSGKEEHHEVRFTTFARTWQRAGNWALTVLPPDRLPATASVDSVLDAAVGIERAKRPEDAAIAYSTIVTKWPDSYSAWMGLGNTRYALKDFVQSETAFRKASALQPKSPQAWNNLAYALLGQGRRAEAIDAAKRAIELAGDKAEPYRATLTEIEAQS
jgi:tetratricopeptide (TPR) repeat protein